MGSRCDQLLTQPQQSVPITSEAFELIGALAQEEKTMTETIKTAKDLALRYLKRKKPFYIEGPPGVGKI